MKIPMYWKILRFVSNAAGGAVVGAIVGANIFSAPAHFNVALCSFAGMWAGLILSWMTD